MFSFMFNSEKPARPPPEIQLIDPLLTVLLGTNNQGQQAILIYTTLLLTTL